jgi:hypothetical protein
MSSLIPYWENSEFDVKQNKTVKIISTRNTYDFECDFRKAIDEDDFVFIKWVMERTSFRFVEICYFYQSDLIKHLDACKLIVPRLSKLYIINFIQVVISSLELSTIKYDAKSKLHKKSVKWFYKILQKNEFEFPKEKIIVNLNFGLLFLEVSKDIKYIKDNWEAWVCKVNKPYMINRLIKIFPELQNQRLNNISLSEEIIEKILRSRISLDVVININSKKYLHMIYYYVDLMYIKINQPLRFIFNTNFDILLKLIRRGRIPIYGMKIPHFNFKSDFEKGFLNYKFVIPNFTFLMEF